MGIEQALSETTAALKEATDAINGFKELMGGLNLQPAAEKSAEKETTKSTGGRGRGRPKKETAASKVDVDLDLDTASGETEGDGLDLGLNDEPAPEPEKKIDPKELKQLLGEVMGQKGREAVLGLMKGFGGKNFDGLKVEDYPAIQKKANALLK